MITEKPRHLPRQGLVQMGPLGGRKPATGWSGHSAAGGAVAKSNRSVPQAPANRWLADKPPPPSPALEGIVDAASSPREVDPPSPPFSASPRLRSERAVLRVSTSLRLCVFAVNPPLPPLPYNPVRVVDQGKSPEMSGDAALGRAAVAAQPCKGCTHCRSARRPTQAWVRAPRRKKPCQNADSPALPPEARSKIPWIHPPPT